MVIQLFVVYVLVERAVGGAVVNDGCLDASSVGSSEVGQVIKGSLLGMRCCARWTTSKNLDEVQVGTQSRPAKIYRQFQESMLAPSVWRQMEKCPYAPTHRIHSSVSQ